MMRFLYAASALGLTSPIGGAAGRFPIDRSGGVLLGPVQQQVIRILPDPVRVDPRRRVPVRDFARAIRRMGEE
jgi:hypothetical protein